MPSTTAEPPDAVSTDDIALLERLDNRESRVRGGAVCVLFVAALAALAAGCGDDEEQVRTATAPAGRYAGERQEQTYEDRRGDVRVIEDAEGAPAREQLDLTRVTLSRAPKELVVSFQTAAPQDASITQRLVVLGPKAVEQALVTVRHDDRGEPVAVVRSARGTPRRVPVEAAGAEVVVRAPLTPLTEEARFSWRALTVTKGEVVDRLPDRVHEFNVFPSRQDERP